MRLIVFCLAKCGLCTIDFNGSFHFVRPWIKKTLLTCFPKRLCAGYDYNFYNRRLQYSLYRDMSKAQIN